MGIKQFQCGVAMLHVHEHCQGATITHNTPQCGVTWNASCLGM